MEVVGGIWYREGMMTLAKQAMATRFELVLGGSSAGLRAAGEEALEEIARVEGMLSLYRETSEVALVNRRAGAEAVRVSGELFALLERAAALSEETAGAFDITIAPLVRAWGFMGPGGARPSAEALAEARANVGWRGMELNGAARTVRFARPGMMLDFGAFGKGYAVDRAVELLREAGVESALLHGGTSTVYGLGAQEDGGSWKVAVEGAPSEKDGESVPVLAVVELRDEALSVSAVWGKSFASQGRTFGHILDARTGEPSHRAELAAVVVASAAESDALSTGLLVEGPGGLEGLLARRTAAKGLVFADGKAVGNWVK